MLGFLVVASFGVGVPCYALWPLHLGFDITRLGRLSDLQHCSPCVVFGEEEDGIWKLVHSGEDMRGGFCIQGKRYRSRSFTGVVLSDIRTLAAQRHPRLESRVLEYVPINTEPQLNT